MYDLIIINNVASNNPSEVMLSTLARKQIAEKAAPIPAITNAGRT